MARSDQATDEQLLCAAVGRLGRDGLFSVSFGGLTRGRKVPITSLTGNRRNSLIGLTVEVHRGLGGRAMSERRPRATSDYGASPHITHDYDAAILGEGIRSLIAVPIVVGRATRGILYGGTHSETDVGGVLAEPAIRVAHELAQEFAVRDEVERRLESMAPEVRMHDRMSNTQLSQLRESVAELRGIASSVADDAALRQRITGVEQRLSMLGGASPASANITLAPRELDVLGYVAIGSSNAHIASSLELAEATVKAYLSSAMTKLGAHTRFEAVQVARRAGLLP